MLDINGNTSLYGIVGQPVAHSLSPLFQNYFLRFRGKHAVYLPFAVQPEALNQALAGLHAAHVQGLNITVPHKEAVLSLVEADTDALVIGAVNTLRRSSLGWEACNTDWLGFAAVLQGLQADVSANPVLLFGAGGTSRAVCHALQQQGVKELMICNRSSDRAVALVADLAVSYPDMQCQVIPWDSSAVAEAVALSATMINSSSVGLADSDVFPFALESAFPGSGVAIDAVYKPNGKTAFCAAAMAGDFAAVDGLPMLVAQGIASFSFWHQEHINKQVFTLPDTLASLRWVEEQLARQPLSLPGWRV